MFPTNEWYVRNSYVKLVANVDGTHFTTTAPPITIFGRDAKLRKTHLGRRFLFHRQIGIGKTSKWEAVYGTVCVLDEANEPEVNAWWAAVTSQHEKPIKLRGRVCVLVRGYGLLDERDARETVREGLDLYYKRSKNSGK